ncbi:MAG: glycogen synthase GlgA [Thomasclavelia sp.]|jgi:starch synthase|nr:glycogen synthase GlgA [Thomasclavelia sp.]
MRVIYAASEATPFIKSGGLADVIGSLPKEMVKKDVESIVIIPKYQELKCQDELEYVTNFDIFMGWRKCYCGVFKAVVDNVTFYFIDNEQYFGRPGLYGYDDDYERFAFFDFAVLEVISHLNIRPDILHLHDWQTAMIAMLYKERYAYYDFYQNIKIIFTIHNIAFQGQADPKLLSELYALDNYLYYNGNCRNDGCFNMMKAAIYYSDIITTVSPTYAQEILTDFFGEGLQDILQMRHNDLYGILNGIDYDVVNPWKDKNLAKRYSKKTVKTGKAANKAALQKEVGLPVDPDVALIGVVTRLTRQKGLDLIINQFEAMCQRRVQIVILGAGDRIYEDALSGAAYNHQDKVSMNLKYDFGLSCRIYAGCDLFLMPSLFEPCGLSQMMSLRYGTIPIVRETGGLKDSVESYNEFEDTGTGFSFSNYNAHEMLDTIDYSLSVYYDHPDRFEELVQRAMSTKLDWDASAIEYKKLYESLM